jgi:hypothetical protein
MTALEIDENSLKVVHVSVIHSHALSNLEIEPRLTWQAGSKGLPDRLNFYFFHWQGRSSHSYDLLDARCHQD